MFPCLIFLQYIVCLQSMNIPNLAMMHWPGDMEIWKKKGCTSKPEPKNQISGWVSHDISSTYNNFNAFPLNIPYVSGWKSVFVTRSVSIWQDLCLAREKQMVQIWSPHPKVPLFLQKEQLEMNIWNFVVGIIIRIRNIFLNTILWSSRSFTAFHSVCQTHETPRSPLAPKKTSSKLMPKVPSWRDKRENWR